MSIEEYISDIITECYNYVTEKDEFVISSHVGTHSGTLEIKTDIIPVSILQDIVKSSELSTEIFEVDNRARLIIHD